MLCLRSIGFMIAITFATGAIADQVILYDDPTVFASALVGLGGTSVTLDFETLPDGTPVPPGDLNAPVPLIYSLFGATNTADFTSAGPLIYEDFVSISPLHSLRDETFAINIAFGAPVAALGVWALDIDEPIPNAASAMYQTTTIGAVSQTYDNTGGGSNINVFFGAIATNDAGTSLAPIITSVLYDQAGVDDFTYLDDLTIGIPEPTAAWLLGLALCSLRRR